MKLSICKEIILQTGWMVSRHFYEAPYCSKTPGSYPGFIPSFTLDASGVVGQKSLVYPGCIQGSWSKIIPSFTLDTSGVVLGIFEKLPWM